MKQQTAVEWLIKEFKANDWWYLPQSMKEDIIKQAKGIEKEQIIEAHFTSSGCNSFDMPTDRINSAYKAAQEYYTETYESNN